MLACAAVLNTIAAVGQLRGRLRIDRLALAVASALAACTVVGNIAALRALATLEPAIASVATHTQVLFVVALAWPLLGERPSRRFWVGAALAGGGFVVMQPTPAAGATVTGEGLLWALLAASMWAAMQVITRAYATRIQPVAINAIRLWLAVAAMACMPGAVGDLSAAPPDLWLLAGAAALAGPFASRVCLMYSVRYISASHSTLIGLVGPVFALGFGVAILGTAPAPVELLGGAIIAAGVAIPLSERLPAQAAQPRPPARGQSAQRPEQP
jgi:drug/metabolite transporter (DMT)-like permease